MKIRVLLPALVGIGLMSGCLKFGEDKELVAPKVTAKHLQQVSALTGIDFPVGASGLAYLYFGSGIDDSLAIKVEIPSAQKDAFLKNEVFQKGSTEAPHLQIGRSKAWWKLSTLEDVTHRKLVLPNARVVECTLGVEDGKLVVYISWIST